MTQAHREYKGAITTDVAAAGYCETCGKCCCNCARCVQEKGALNICAPCFRATQKAMTKKAGA